MWVEVGGPVENIVHQFCECPKVSEVWGWLRGQIVMELLENGQGQCSDFELLHFAFPESMHDNTIVWMLSVYADFVYNETIILGKSLRIDKLKAVLCAKYLENQNSKRPDIGYIPFALV